MISEEIKSLDVFAKKNRLQKILSLEFMSEELLEELIELFPPITKKIASNCKDLTAMSQKECIEAFPNQRHEHNEGCLTALYMLDDQKQKGHKNWLCWNTRTNNVYGSVETYNFTSLHSNGITNDTAGESYALRDIRRCDHNIDLTGKSFGYIKIIKATGDRQVGDARREWLAYCEACNREFLIDSHEVQRMAHCGCLSPYSNEVILIRKLLDENNIKYKQEYTFDNCRDVNALPFDFAIEDENGRAYLLEYDGKQHFESVTHWGGLEKTRTHDLIKNKYCFNNDIPLIRIPYNADYTIDDLKLGTTRFLLTPENEKFYYESRK